MRMGPAAGALLALALVLASGVPSAGPSTASSGSAPSSVVSAQGPSPAVIHPAGSSWSWTPVCTGGSSPSCVPNPPTFCAQSTVASAGDGGGHVLFVTADYNGCTFYNPPFAVVVWQYNSTTATWANLTTSSGASVLQYDGYNQNLGCLAWDPSGSGDWVLTAVNGSTNTEFDTFTLAPGGTWAQSTAIVTDVVNAQLCSMAWWPGGNELVMLAMNAAETQPETETWDGSAWTNDSGANAAGSFPCFVEPPALAYDPASTDIVAFGGTAAECTSPTSQWIDSYTVQFDGTWTNLTSSLGSGTPPARTNALAATLGDGAAFFGGADVNHQYYGDTWYWSGGQWTNESPTPGPAARSWAEGGPVSSTTAIAFGGCSATSGSPNCFSSPVTYSNDTWLLTSPSSGGGGSSSSPPANGTATTSASLGCGSETLSWTNGPAPAGTTLVNVTVYLYQGTTNDSAPVQVISTNGPASSLQVNDLECWARYVFQLLDWYSSGLAGPLSGEFSFTTADALGSVPPTCLSCGSATSWWPWVVLAFVVLVAVVALLSLYSNPRRGERARRIG